MGFTSFFANFVQIAVLMLVWLLVLIAFFILAVQLFVTLIEFKLTTLAGFVLIPFALFNKTAFLAEKVLGNVVASGVKVMVLAVIVGIGTGLFSQFTAGYGGSQPTIEQALSLVLAALALLGLGIFGPGIATGLVSGAPQLGAGAAVGTGLAVAGAAMASGAALGLAGRGTMAAASGAAAAARRGAAMAGGAAAAYSLASAADQGQAAWRQVLAGSDGQPPLPRSLPCAALSPRRWIRWRRASRPAPAPASPPPAAPRPGNDRRRQPPMTPASPGSASPPVRSASLGAAGEARPSDQPRGSHRG